MSSWLWLWGQFQSLPLQSLIIFGSGWWGYGGRIGQNPDCVLSRPGIFHSGALTGSLSCIAMVPRYNPALAELTTNNAVGATCTFPDHRVYRGFSHDHGRDTISGQCYFPGGTTMIFRGPRLPHNIQVICLEPESVFRVLCNALALDS